MNMRTRYLSKILLRRNTCFSYPYPAHHTHFPSQTKLPRQSLKLCAKIFSVQKQFLHGGSSKKLSSMVDIPFGNNSENRELKMEILSDDGIVKMSLNRAQKANAMGKIMLSQLQEAIKVLNSDSYKNMVKCVILTSQSEKVFSAGADLKERSKMTVEEASLFVSSLRATFDDLSNLPMPVIACVEVRRNIQ